MAKIKLFLIGIWKGIEAMFKNKSQQKSEKRGVYLLFLLPKQNWVQTIAIMIHLIGK